MPLNKAAEAQAAAKKGGIGKVLLVAYHLARSNFRPEGYHLHQSGNDPAKAGPVLAFNKL